MTRNPGAIPRRLAERRRGFTWKRRRHLEKDPAEKESFAYPSPIQTRDGLLHATYSLSTRRASPSDTPHSISSGWPQAIPRPPDQDSGNSYTGTRPFPALMTSC